MSIIKLVLKSLCIKSDRLLLLPTLHFKMPGFQLRRNTLQPAFMYVLKILSQVEINLVLVRNLTLCHKMKPSV